MKQQTTRTMGMTPPTPSELFARLDATGIGYAGVDGAWWLPAQRPFELSAAAREQLRTAGAALFALFDAVGALYRTEAGAVMGLDALLEHKVPAHLRLHTRSPVLSLRPDFQLVGAIGSGDERLIATELEICPSAQGFAHAMQRAAGLAPDLAQSIAHRLAGRTLLIIATQRWSEFLFDQAAFCRALEECGAAGRLLLDLPLAELERSVRAGERWQPPIFGLDHKPPRWNPCVLERLEASGLRRFVDDSATWPARLDGALIFRFGYLDCFSPTQLRRLAEWEEQGTPSLNPCSFLWDSKVVMATARLPALRARLAERYGHNLLDALDAALPETRLLTAQSAAALVHERSDWVLKFAGFDGGDQAWGGRSLRVGAQLGDAAWRAALAEAVALSFPVVAQRLTPSARLTAEYGTRDGQSGVLRDGVSRLRAFLVRTPSDGGNVGEIDVAGAHITLAGSVRVSEASDAVQGPVCFVNGDGRAV